MKEVKEEVRERKGRGGMSTLIPSFPTPHFNLGSLNFYWLKSNKHIFSSFFFSTVLPLSETTLCAQTHQIAP
jgi:hypothetical protein